MSTLQSKKNPGSRRDAGDAVLANAKAVDTRPVRDRLAAFTKIHRAYVAADDKVRAADDAVRASQRTMGELDEVQDVAVEALVAALVGEGASRTRPLAPYKLGTPTDLKELGDVAEAKAIGTLVARVRKSKPGAKVLAACAAAEKAAKAVLAAEAPLQKRLDARRAAIAARDAFALSWEKAFGALKRGARAAEDDGAVGLFDALFAGGAPRTSKTRGKPATGGNGSRPVVVNGSNGAAGNA